MATDKPLFHSSAIETMDALTDFSLRYVQAHQQAKGHYPITQELADWPSPALMAGNAQDNEGYWQPAVRELKGEFSNIEQALERTLHPDIKAFYAHQFAADMKANWQGNSLSLVQVWNEEDFTRLQENIIGHLLMQKRLGLQASVFIATTDSELDVISLCELSGEVIFERLGTKQRDILAPSLAHFLFALEPLV